MGADGDGDVQQARADAEGAAQSGLLGLDEPTADTTVAAMAR